MESDKLKVAEVVQSDYASEEHDTELHDTSTPSFNQTASERSRQKTATIDEDFITKNAFQVKLLLWKRYLEFKAGKIEFFKIIGCSLMFFVLLILLDDDLLSFLPKGLLEFFIVPLAFWAYAQRIVIQITTEKCSRVKESMKICGLTDFSYWSSYFISDGIILGFVLSLLCSIMTVGGLFDDGSFIAIFGLFFVFCLSTVPFCMFLSTFMNSPQSAGQFTLVVLIGLFIIPVILLLSNGGSLSVGDLTDTQAISIICLFPPMALQLGSLSFASSGALWPSTYPSTATICAWMFLDIFLYLILAWYFAQVIPSPVGTTKPFYFIFQPSYWCSSCTATAIASTIASPVTPSEYTKCSVSEEVDEAVAGKPTITVSNLRKSFGSYTAIKDLSFEMYENQIFVLLGHNGAGKTTAINMLTGMNSPDSSDQSKISIYGYDIHTEMDHIRHFMGVCPQHDVFFDKLTVQEHIVFFARLKGLTIEAAEVENTVLTQTFHLEDRKDHLGHELSGGQRRKLSFAIAACGGSRFIVLDEPTAGMDPLARRELWDILASLRHGRTILLTTHYMDEADILGDRVGIMSLGVMQCLGSTQFLKNTYGSGYTLIFDKPNAQDFKQDELTSFIKTHIPDASLIEDECGGQQVLYNLPFDSLKDFGPFFVELENNVLNAGQMPSEYGVAVTTLEDVFLKVGADDTVTPNQTSTFVQNAHGIGSSVQYTPTLSSQIIGIAMRKVLYTCNDRGTLAVLLLPVGAIITAAVLFKEETVSKNMFIRNLTTCALYIGAYLGAPGIIGEFLSRERKVRLRNVLTVMGCDFKAYWIGTLLADYVIMLIPTIVMWISWVAADMTDFLEGQGGLGFCIILMFNFHMIALSYFCSLLFEDPSYCILIMPILIILLLVAPVITQLIIVQIYDILNDDLPQDVMSGVLLWGIMSFSPHGAMFSAFLDVTTDLGTFVTGFPPAYASILFMLGESIALFGYCYWFDIQSMGQLESGVDDTFDPACLDDLHEDVVAERQKAAQASIQELPLVVQRLRKVFPSKTAGRDPVVATQDISFAVGNGEILGLLGANGAGKSSTLSMLTRALVPTSGDATIASFSILNQFSKGATHLGVVTQNNSLWDKLSVESHLFLFARLRGVPEKDTQQIVSSTIDLLELTPHRYKLAARLSGGMKRKLCVAIALIGDPDVVLLDEPSAGLDPVSRRNLWSVILKTMSHRAVVLTTHSMEEADALCSKIAIMVLGQVQAMGTKQRLKTEFGSGFELTIKAKPHLNTSSAADVLHCHNAFKQAVSEFVNGMYPSATIVSENGGLLTYQIPKEEIRIGEAFNALQAHSERLNIENYTIAQPTLEQVFIKTVKKHSPVEKVTPVDSVVGEDGVVIPVASEDRNFFTDEYYRHQNKCGCIEFQMKVGCALVFLVFVVFFFLSAPRTKVSEIVRYCMFAMTYLSFFVCCGLMCFIYCPCCKAPPQDQD